MTLRRRLLLFSVPVALVLVVVLVKSLSVVIAGGSAADAFADRDVGTLRGDVATLNVLNVAEPAKASFAAGALAVLDGRLTEAEAQFAESLLRSGQAQSCPVRVNLELVRETLGDRAFDVFQTPRAIEFYESALTVVEEAPQGCFEGNTDSDEERRAVRNDAANRLNGKLEAARTAAPPPPPPPLPVAAPPPPPPTDGSAPADQDTRLRLDPSGGDPLEKLQQILRDAAAAAGN